MTVATLETVFEANFHHGPIICWGRFGGSACSSFESYEPHSLYLPKLRCTTFLDFPMMQEISDIDFPFSGDTQ